MLCETLVNYHHPPSRHRRLFLRGRLPFRLGQSRRAHRYPEMLLSSIVLAFALPLARAVVVRAPRDFHDHSDEVGRALPGSWYHEPDHPVHALFKRAPGDGTTYAPVGTPGKPYCRMFNSDLV